MSYNNILLIDDDVEERDVFSLAVNEINPSVILTSMGDATKALQALRNKSIEPDVIFVDLNMPVMNGQEFLVEIKKDERLHTIPVIVFTTSSHKPTIELVKILGAKQFITKPGTFDELVAILSSLIQGGAAGGFFDEQHREESVDKY